MGTLKWRNRGLESEDHLWLLGECSPVQNVLPAERARRDRDRDAPFTRPPCSQENLVKACWGTKELSPLLTLDKGAEVPRNHHTRCIAAVPTPHRCAFLGRL